jgi:hypothetical protein
MNINHVSIGVELKLHLWLPVLELGGFTVSDVFLHSFDLGGVEGVIDCLPEASISNIGVNLLILQVFVLNSMTLTISASI